MGEKGGKVVTPYEHSLDIISWCTGAILRPVGYFASVPVIPSCQPGPIHTKLDHSFHVWTIPRRVQVVCMLQRQHIFLSNVWKALKWFFEGGEGQPAPTLLANGLPLKVLQHHISEHKQISS
jgi:hypothetical protein